MTNCKCGERLKTREQLRRGFCTVDCQRAHAHGGASTAPVVASGNGVTVRPTVTRRHGTDRKAVNE